jgi:hypothetical protein
MDKYSVNLGELVRVGLEGIAGTTAHVDDMLDGPSDTSQSAEQPGSPQPSFRYLGHRHVEVLDGSRAPDSLLINGLKIGAQKCDI